MRTVAIIQARMGSERLPKKVLADIHGQPMLFWLLKRIKSVDSIDEIVVATTECSSDDFLVQWLKNINVKFFRGSVDDVLHRYYETALKFNADIIVRITADDPLKDPSIISQAIQELKDNQLLDYCSNTIEPTYPEGLDIEVFKFTALKKCHFEAKLFSEREHVTPYIWKNKHLFNVKNFKYNQDLSYWRWTVDKPEDLTFMRSIFEHFKEDPLVGFEKVVDYIKLNPYLLTINTMQTVRNEGYLKSILGESHE